MALQQRRGSASSVLRAASKTTATTIEKIKSDKKKKLFFLLFSEISSKEKEMPSAWGDVSADWQAMAEKVDWPEMRMGLDLDYIPSYI